MFPGPNATIYRNEAGEVMGWSDESSYEPDYDEIEREYDATHCIDCGELHNECKCDLYCASCGEYTYQENDECTNQECPSNAPSEDHTLTE